MTTEQTSALTADQFMRKPEVQLITTLSDSTIRKLELEGQFPKRRLIGKRVVGWYRNQVLHWLATREVIEVH